MHYMKGFTRRKKVALLSLTAVFAVSMIAAGSAWAWSVTVAVQPQPQDFCQPAPDLISYRLGFTARAEAAGIAPPDKIRIGYQVVDRSTKRVLRSGVVMLLSSKNFVGQTPRMLSVASQKVSYHLNMSYQVGGRISKSKKTYPDVIPSQEELDASVLPVC
jgi:hypothetical protein